MIRFRTTILMLVFSVCFFSAGARDTAVGLPEKEDTSRVENKKKSGPIAIDNWGDASRYIRQRRDVSAPKTPFVTDKFRENLHLGVVGLARAPFSDDYAFAYGAGVSALKWFNTSLGVRADVLGEYMHSNLTGNRVGELSVGCSLLFNVSSYISGFDKMRFCEVSTVMGVGYSCRWDLMTEHYFAGNVGVNVNMRLSKGLSLYLEPHLPLYLGIGGLTYGFATSAGIYYDLSTQLYEPTIAGKYYVFCSGGMQLQNSELVKMASDKDYSTIGYTTSLGFGRRFDDYLALRLSALYSTHTWTVYYGGKAMPARYFAFRAEVEFDALSLILDKCGVKNFPLGFGVVLGPEAGCLIKKDLGETLTRHYVGLTGAFHLDYHFGKRVGVFIEPRMSLLPYSAPHDSSTANNAYRNYYDGLFNLTLGIEVDI